MDLEEVEVERLIKRVAANLGYDYYGGSNFPEGRKEVCAAKYTTENGSTYGYDTIYLVYKDKSGEIHYETLINSKSTKDYINVKEVLVTEETNEKIKVSVTVYSGGSYSGKAWEKTLEKTINL